MSAGTVDYIRDGAAIYARSFAVIRAEARLSRFSAMEERVAVRIIHACGMVEIANDIVFPRRGGNGCVGRFDPALRFYATPTWSRMA